MNGWIMRMMVCLAVVVMMGLPCRVAAFDLWEVQITTFNVHVNAAPEDVTPFSFEIWVNGDFADVGRIEATTPAGSNISTMQFELDPGNGSWNTDIPIDYEDLAALQADYGTGDYTIAFYDSSDALIDSVTLAYDPPLPGGFATITAPTHQADDVPFPSDTFTWTDPSGLGLYLDLVLDLVIGDDDERVDASFQQTIEDTEFTTNVLEPGRDYWFNVAVGTAIDGTTVSQQPVFPVRSSDNGDSFVYIGGVQHIESAFFTTVPEPGTAVLLIGLGVLNGALRRRAG